MDSLHYKSPSPIPTNRHGKISLNKIPPLKISNNQSAKEVNFNTSNWVQLDKFKVRPFGSSPISDRASTAIHTPLTLRKKYTKSSAGNSNPLSGIHSRTQSQQLYTGADNLQQSMTSSQLNFNLANLSNQNSNLLILQQQKQYSNASSVYQQSEGKFNHYINQYITTNELFTKHQDLIKNLEHIQTQVKQQFDIISINNEEQMKKKKFGLLNQQTKSILFSLLDKLNKQIIQQFMSSSFHDFLIHQTIEILNELGEIDAHLSTFCEGIYKFFICFMDQIISRLKYKIKKEMNQKYMENEKLIEDQKLTIVSLNKEIESLHLKIQEEKQNTKNIEGKLRDEIINLNSTIQEMKYDLQDMQNLDFAPAQLEKIAKTTSKMSSFIKKEAIITQQSEIKAESQLLALSNVLIAMSRKRLDDSEILSKKCNFYSSYNEKVSRLFGEHPFTRCLHHMNFLGMQGKIYSKYFIKVSIFLRQYIQVEEKQKGKKNIKNTLTSFFSKHFMQQKSESNPAEQIIDYLQNETNDYEEVCQQIGDIVYYLKDFYEKDAFSYYFSQLFGLFENPIPSKEEIKLQILLYSKLQYISDERKNEDNDDNLAISIAQFERQSNTPQFQSEKSTVKFHSGIDNMNVGTLNNVFANSNTFQDFQNLQTQSIFEYNLSLEYVFEEIPWNMIVRIFDQMDQSLQFQDTIKQKVQIHQITAVSFLSKILQLSTIDSKDQINSQINLAISKFQNNSTNQQKLNSPELMSLCTALKIKPSYYIQNTLHMYVEELQVKQKLLNSPIAEITDNDFNDLLKNSIHYLLKLQRFGLTPFLERQQFSTNYSSPFKQSQTHEAINEESANTNASLNSNDNLTSNSRRLFKKSFNKIKVQNSLSKLGSKNNLESPLSERVSPLSSIIKSSSIAQGPSSPKKTISFNADPLLNSKYSKFKK